MLTLRGTTGFRRGAVLQDLSIIEDGAVLIREGVVDSVGPSRRMENLREARGAIAIPVHGRVVMPGFIDLGLRVFVPSTRRKSFLHIRNDASTLLSNCLHYGTTSIELESGGSDDPAIDLPLLRQAVKVGVEGDVVYSWRLQLPRKDPDNQWDARLAEQLRYVVRHHQARFLTLDPGGSSLDVFYRTLGMAQAVGLQLKLISRPETGDDFLQFGPQRELISVTGPSLCPGGNLNTIASLPSAAVFRPLLGLGRPLSEQCSLTGFITAGGAPVLASGHDEQSPSFSMQAVVELAVLRHGLTLEQALSAATINAAYAVGCGTDRGNLEVGKRADILVLNLSDYRDITRQLGINYVGMVIRRGVVVFNRTSWRIGSAGR